MHVLERGGKGSRLGSRSQVLEVRRFARGLHACRCVASRSAGRAGPNCTSAACASSTTPRSPSTAASPSPTRSRTRSAPISATISGRRPGLPAGRPLGGRSRPRRARGPVRRPKIASFDHESRRLPIMRYCRARPRALQASSSRPRCRPWPAGADAPAGARLVPARPDIYAPVTLTANLARSLREGAGHARAIHRCGADDGRALLGADVPGRPGQAACGNYGPGRTPRSWNSTTAPGTGSTATRRSCPGSGPKPPGAGYYPLDMTKEEFEKADLPGKTGRVQRACAATRPGNSPVVPYSVEWREPLGRAAGTLEKAASLAEDPGLAKYLDLRAKALAHRRLPGQRHRVAGHEGQPHRPRDRSDRVLRRQALRLQDRLRGLRAGEGHGMEQAPRALRGDAAGAAARPAGAGRVQGREARHATPT